MLRQKQYPTLQEGSKGPAVIELQNKLAAAGFSPGTIDGDFGARTKAAVIAFQRARGLVADGIVGSLTWAALDEPAPEPVPVSGLREKIVAEAMWGVTNTASIHYAQVRPMDGINQRRKLPLNTDCSGFVTLCYKWAGVPDDPNGYGYNGSGYTGAMLRYMTQVSQSAVRPGDLVLWSRNGDGEHVALVVETGSDPLLVSHGQESGPYTVRFSASNRSHAGATVNWLRLAAVDQPQRAPRPSMAPEMLRRMPMSLEADAPTEEGLAPRSEPVAAHF